MKNQKLNGQSQNIPDKLKAQLYNLMPEIFTEGKHSKIDWEKLKATLGEDINTENERYHLNWAGKSDAFKTLQTPITNTVTPRQDESINFDTSENIFIEGDNLDVLKALQKSYHSKIKMIYIDPPYNTGSDAFIYPDNYKESKADYSQRVGDIDEDGNKAKDTFKANAKENGHYHSNWLNMMYPRLFLARSLLKEDGVIFVSIDDNEVHNLRMIMNEVFGSENYRGTIVWQHSVQPKGYSGTFSVHHNLILCYAKSGLFILNNLPRLEEHNKNYSNPDNDPCGPWRSGDVRNALYRPNLIFEIKTPSGKVISPPEKGWRWSRETINQKIANGEIKFSNDETRIIRKIYLKNIEGRTPETLLLAKDVGSTRDASTEVKKIFDGKKPFDTPKPTRLISHFCTLSNINDSDIILDFFAGSCTTAHAVLDLNKEDNGNRKFICVQLPEPCNEKSEAFKAGYKTIADIGKERIRRVIKKNNQENTGFKAYKLTNSHFKQWQTNIQTETDLIQQLDFIANPIQGNPSHTDLITEILLKSGLTLTSTIDKQNGYYLINQTDLAIILDPTDDPIIKDIITKTPQTVIALDSAFQNNDQLKTNTYLQLKEKNIEFKTI